MKKPSLLFTSAMALALAPIGVHAGVFVFNTINPTDRVTHPHGYDGSGGDLYVSVCINPGSTNKSQLEMPLRNAIRTWNAKQATTGNIKTGSSNNVPSNRFDVETVLVHELGHCVGLDHPHLDNLSGVSSSNRGYTHANRGANLKFDLDPGVDSIQGSHLDERGDDWNLHWFIKGENNPFIVPDVVDQTTVGIWPNALPAGHKFVANANRHVGSAMGFPKTQSVMVQNIRAGEAVRTLAGDDVVTLLFAHAGVDRFQGTADSYNLVLEYGGVQSGCDINVEMKGTSFAYCQVTAETIDSRNIRLTSANLRLGSPSTFNWFFNTESNEHDTGSSDPEPKPEPEPEPEPEPNPVEDLIFDDQFTPK